MRFSGETRLRLRFATAMVIATAVSMTNLNISPVSASGALTLNVDYTPDSSLIATEVTPGNKVDLTAVAPVSIAGTTSQMVTMEIEPYLVLTGTSDIRYPSGWTVHYSVDGTTWTTLAPTTPTGWAAIRHVKAEGPLVSEGTDSSGRQIASTDANAAQPTTGQFPTTSGSSGDGWDVFFDDGGRLYNVWHHNGSGSNQSIDCYLRTGVRCNGTWPYLLRSGVTPVFTMHTNEQSAGLYDPVQKEIWFPTVYTADGVNQVGFACIRVDDITLTNKWCGGSAATAFVSAGAGANIAGTTCVSTTTSNDLYDCTGGLAKSGNKIYTWQVATGDLLCVDITLNAGAGGPCTTGGIIDFGASLTNVSSDGNRWRPLVMELNGKIYGNGGRYASAICIEAATGSPCTGWTNPRAISNKATRIFPLPNAAGTVVGACFIALDTAPTCFDLTGANITSSLTTSFTTSIKATYRSTYDAYGALLQQYRTRLYWGDSAWATGTGKIYCWDFGTNTWCRNWTSSGISDTNYQIVLDPYNPNCLWSNSHDGIIQTYDTYSGQPGNCAVPAPTAVFDAGAGLPRMACAQDNAIQEWKSFTLTADFAYTSATLTIKKSDGTAIAGWTNVPIPGNSPKTVDLSSLSVAASGQSPSLTVTFTGRTEYGEVSARTTAVGGSPELCLRPTAITCPTGPVFQASQLASRTTQVDATGSAVAGNTTSAFSPATATVNVGAMNSGTCSANLSGTALTTASSPVVGALVTLTNGTGTPLMYPDDYADATLRGQTISVLTNASGQYSFPYVVPGSYAVRFTDVSTAAVTGTSVIGGTTTSETTTAITQLTSASKTLVAGTSGVIDATYTVLPKLTKKFLPTTVAKGQISTLIFTLNNSAGNGAKSGLGFVDTLPSGLVVDTNANMMTTCPGGSTVALDPASMTASSGVITVTNASINAGVASCEYSIAVRADTAGTYTNDASNVTTTGLAEDLLATKVVTNDSVSGKFACSSNMYHIIGSQLYQMNPRDSRAISYEIGPNTLGGINAIGFNVVDGYMYGIATTTANGRTAGNLVRIDSSGAVTDLGAISGVASSDMTAIVGGDFDGQGNLVVKKTGLVSTLYSINVSTRAATTITTSITVGGADLAYVNGEFYSVRQQNFYKITRSAGTTWTATVRAIFPTNYADSPVVYANGFGEVIVVDPNRSAYVITNPATASASSSFVKMFDFGTLPVDGAMCNDVPVPTAQPDTTSGPLNTAQSVNLLTNDVKTISAAGVSTNFDASSIRLCNPNSNPAEVAPNCTVTPGTTITVSGVGDYVVNSSGVVTFTPVSGYSGTPPPMGYQVKDTNNQIASSSYTPTVTSTTPVAVDDTSTGTYDTNQTIAPLANDIAGSLGTIVPNSVRLCSTTTTADSSCTLTSLTISGEGTYTANPDGTVTFDPLPSFTGTASPIKYVVDDSAAQRTSAEIQVTVGMPSAPTANPESKTVIPGGTTTFTTLTGVSGLATAQAPFDTAETCLITPGSSPASCDADGIITVANEGTYTLNTATGIVTFEADMNITAGTKTALKYQVTDVTGQTAISTLTPVVPPPPSATNDTSSGAYDTNQTIAPLTNDVAGSGATLVTSSVKLCATTSTVNSNCNLTTLTVAGEGTYTVNANGTVTFDPLSTFTGTASPVKYVVADTTGQVTNATITPTVAMPTAPVATPESKSVIPGGTATFTTITGAGGLATSGVGLDASLTCLITPGSSPASCDADGIVTIAGQGTYSLNTSTGVVTYTADANATAGTKTAITYRVTDSFGQTATSTLTPMVPPPPTATNDSSSGAYNTNQTLSPLLNDSAGAGATLTSSSLRLCETTTTANSSCTLTTLVIPFVGTYVVNSDGTVLFDPVETFTGQAPAVKYVVVDSTGQIANAELTTSVGTPAVPVATPESRAVIPGATATFTTITGAGGLATSGVGLDASLTCLITPGSSPPTCDADGIVTIAGEGTYTLNVGTGVVTFAADANATQGTKTAITYRVTDITGQTATSTLTPVIPAPPVASNDTSSGAYDTNQTISILINDTVTSPATLIASSVKLCATTSTVNSSCNLTTLTVAGEGTYTVNANGTVTFDPLPSFTGTASPVKYVVVDSTGQVTNATITPSVSLPNAPTATPESRAVIPGATATFTTITGAGGLATSGVGLDASLTCLITPGSSPASCDADGVVVVAGQGTYTLNASTGVVTFAADANATQGSKTPITYRVTDIFGQTTTSTLTPVIPAPPVASNDTSSGAYDTNQTISILTNDSVTSPATLVASTVKLCATTSTANASCNLTTLTVAGEGTYTVNANGTVTFDPLPSFTGVASPVKYVVADSTGQVTNATITPTVALPAVPVATPESKAVIPGGTATFTTVTASNGLATSPVNFNTGATCLYTPNTTACDADGIIVIAGEGTYTLNTSTGVVTFVAEANATQGTKTPITYKVTDIFGQSATSTLTPVIPAPPVASNDTSSGAYDVNQTISILLNDSATSPATLVASTVKLCATTSTVNSSCNLTTLTVVGEGTYTVNTNGTVTFDPLPTFTGTASPVKYVVADSTGQVTNATITPTVLVPPAPSATNNVSSGAFDTNQLISPLANDSFSASTPALFSTLKLCALDDPNTGANEAETPGNCTKTSVTVAGEGTYTVNANGTVTFDPFPMFVGTVQTPVRYQASDILGRTVNATITPTVLPPPPPVAAPQTLAVVAGGTVTFSNVSGNNGLASGVGLQSGSTNGPCIIDPSTQVCGTSVTINGEGTWTIDRSTGIATFVAVAGLREGTHTPVTYRVTDYFGQTATSTLTPVVPAAPRATNDVSTGLVDVNQLLTPFKNDSFHSLAPVDLSTLRLCQPSTVTAASAAGTCTLLTVTVPGEGTYTVNANGTVTFDPLPTFTGVATAIPYEAVNVLGERVEALLTPTVLAAKVVNQQTTTKPSTPALLSPLALGAPSIGNSFVTSTLKLYDPLTKKWSTKVVTSQGLWELKGASVKFTPASDFAGTAVLPFRVKDTAGISVRAQLTVVVKGKPSLPKTGVDVALLLLMGLTFIAFGTAVSKRK
jgi:CshA-type fibril repeat protein